MGRIRLDDIRKQELIDAAIRAVASHGLEKATVAVIGREADISPGIVHHYFGDKTTLLESAMRAIRAPFSGLYAENIAKQPENPAIRLPALIDTCFDPAVFSPVTASAWTAFVAVSPHVPAFGRVRSLQRRRMVSTASHALRGRVEDRYRLWYADAVTTAIDGVWFNAATVEGAADSDRARTYLEMVLAGFPPIQEVNHG